MSDRDARDAMALSQNVTYVLAGVKMHFTTTMIATFGTNTSTW
jgi:hypothetical protein